MLINDQNYVLTYRSSSLVNFSIGHSSLDAGKTCRNIHASGGFLELCPVFLTNLEGKVGKEGRLREKQLTNSVLGKSRPNT